MTDTRQQENETKAIESEFCPVCGYYCYGKGGAFCIDKPSLLALIHSKPAEGK